MKDINMEFRAGYVSENEKPDVHMQNINPLYPHPETKA